MKNYRQLFPAACISLLTVLPGALFAAPDIKVKGLFPNRAVLEINGEPRVVKAGERTDEGILLVSSDSKSAVIEVDGVRRTLGLSGQIASEFTEASVREVVISQSGDSHFRVNGSINGYPVKMLVDTGATAIAMNASAAGRMGIDYLQGQKGHATTAAGPVESYLVDLNSVSVGGIDVHNIKAVVLTGDFPSQILLGNTFLQHVEMEQKAGSLILRSKY